MKFYQLATITSCSYCMFMSHRYSDLESLQKRRCFVVNYLNILHQDDSLQLKHVLTISSPNLETQTRGYQVVESYLLCLILVQQVRNIDTVLSMHSCIIDYLVKKTKFPESTFKKQLKSKISLKNVMCV